MGSTGLSEKVRIRCDQRIVSGSWQADARSVVLVVGDTNRRVVKVTGNQVQPLGIETGTWRTVRCHPLHDGQMLLEDTEGLHIAHGDATEFLCWIAALGAHDVEYDPTGQYGGVSSESGVSIWDLENRRRIVHLETGAGPLAMANSRFAACGSNDLVLVQDLQSGDELAQLDCDAISLETMCFTRDGSTLAMGYTDGRLIAHSITDGTETVLSVRGAWVYEAEFCSADRIAALYKDGVLRLWDVSQGLILGESPIGAHALLVNSSGGIAALCGTELVLFDSD